MVASRLILFRHSFSFALIRGFLALIIIFFATCGNAAELRLELDKTESEMGKYFSARLIYHGVSDPGPVNISLWQDDFFADQFDAELSATDDGLIETSTLLYLYPRHTGDITLDSIALGGSFIKPQHLLVSPSIRNEIDATPIVHSLKPFYWADQAIMISLEAPLHDNGNSIIVEDFNLPGFTVSPPRQTRLSSPKGDSIRFEWMLLSPQKGIYDVELPIIKQRGRGRFRFHLPKLKLNIRPLPAYLPTTVPVGLLNIQSDLIQSVNNQWLWQITVENPGRLPEQLEGFQEFLNKLNIEEAEISNKISIDKTSRVYKLKVPEWNLIQPQPLKLVYFNTTTGQLEYLQHTLSAIWTIPKYAQWTAVFMLMLLLFYVGYKFDKLATTIRQWRQFRLTIKQTQTPHQLRQLILKNTTEKTLTDWARHTSNSITDQIAENLNTQCFNQNQSDEIESLKKSCLQYFKFPSRPGLL